MTLVHALEAVAESRPMSPALAWRSAEWTYGELRHAVAVVRSALSARALAPRARIALLLRNSPQYVALYYGVLAADCVAVPLNAHERAPVLARQVQHCAAAMLVGEREHPEWGALTAALRPGGLHACPEIVGTRLDEGADAIASLALDLAAPEPSGDANSVAGDDDLAAIIYTSGTTGRPKGVMLSHRNLRANAEAIIVSLGLTPEDRGLCVLPLHFSYGNSVLHSHMLCGARLRLEENFAYPQTTLKRLQDEGITDFPGVPSTFAMLLGRHRLEDFDLKALRILTQAGGPMPRALAERLRSKLPGARLFLMYGQTEATARLTCLQPEDFDRKSGSVGLPIRDVEIVVREGDAPLGRGIVGEICARGPNVMLGYWNDPDATESVLRDGWLRTGDLGHMDDDGYVYISGRTVDMIKVGAFRVSPGEIEEVIAELDGVQEAAVVGIPDEILGQAIKAVVVVRPDSELTPMEVKAHCRRYLAAYKVPKTVDFTSTLPRTSSGKVQRYRLTLDATNET
jgi:long-chain acyl-CoA synthetase